MEDFAQDRICRSIFIFSLLSLTVQMKAFNDRQCSYTQCDKIRSRPLEDSCENGGPTNSQWRKYFNHPELCEDRETWLRGHLPMNNDPVVGGYRGCKVLVLYFEHSLAIGVLVTTIGIVTTIFAILWAIKKNDLSGGFGIGGYFFAFIAFVATFYFGGSVLGWYS